MLILTRKVNESILVGEDIRIKVVSVEGNNVKLGITAPKNVSVVREELVEAVKKENLSAGKTTGDIDFSIFKPPEGGDEEVD